MVWLWAATALVVGGACYIGYESGLPCLPQPSPERLGLAQGSACLPQVFAGAVAPALLVVASVMLFVVAMLTTLKAINRRYR